MSKDQMRLLKFISQVSFALTETNLYLDTHPDDPKALECYRKYRHLREQTMADYVNRFGPIDSMQVESDSRWTWVDTPWPWEGTV